VDAQTGDFVSANRKKTVQGSLCQLGDLVHKAGIRLTPVPPTRSTEKPKPIIAEVSHEPTDEEVFAQAMNDVERISWRHIRHLFSKPVRTYEPDAQAEARRLMQNAMDEHSPITIPNHPEYIEGWVGVAGKRFLPNLRNGLYSIQGQIDLHGLNREEAQTAVEHYIVRMSRFRSCCIKIIHGRGINSPADRVTLKESLQRFLSTRRMSRYVVAYASAPFRDGGVGAVYVLLCRQYVGKKPESGR
jgi:DNA-nicking Smr family endonuclease